jgi:hypothetical protein
MRLKLEAAISSFGRGLCAEKESAKASVLPERTARLTRGGGGEIRAGSSDEEKLA